LTPTANHAKHHDGKADNRVRPSRHAHRQAKNVDQNGNSEFTAPNADHPGGCANHDARKETQSSFPRNSDAGYIFGIVHGGRL